MTFRQDIMAVIEGFEEAWKYFGEIAAIAIINNLKPGVKKPDRYNLIINKDFFN